MSLIDKFTSICTQAKLGGGPTQLLTVQELQAIPIQMLFEQGFRNWDNSMVLLPEWCLDWIQPGEKLRCIDGLDFTVGVDPIDRDTRGGCIAFGVLRQDIPPNKG